jgi:hypothetical protein
MFIIEIGGRIIYYQMHGQHKTVISAAFYRIKNKIENTEIKNTTEAVPKSFRRKALVGLYHEKGREVLAQFQELYEKSFIQLAGEAKRLGSKLIFLYIPMYYEKDDASREVCRTFFKELAQRHHVDFLDMTDVMLGLPVDMVTLSPHNAHLSRYGNQIVARELSRYVERYSNWRMQTACKDRPAILGDLAPNGHQIWPFVPAMPYRVVTNSQGFRMTYDLKFPKEKQRILCLGDSYTFGPYLANHDTYPDLMAQKFPNKEVINAGICGYTIADEVSLFNQRSKYCEPDIIILQTLDNDISDFFYFYRNQFAREPKDFKPAAKEKAFLKRLQEEDSVSNPK